MHDVFEDLDYLRRNARKIFAGSLCLMYNQINDDWEIFIETLGPDDHLSCDLGSYPAHMTYETMFRLARNRLEAIRKEQEDE